MKLETLYIEKLQLLEHPEIALLQTSLNDRFVKATVERCDFSCLQIAQMSINKRPWVKYISAYTRRGSNGLIAASDNTI